MVQQVNLLTAEFRAVKKRFGARAVVATLAAGVLVLGAGCAAYVWKLGETRKAHQQLLTSQLADMESLKAALAKSLAAAAPPDASLVAQLADRKLALAKRETLAAAIRDGVFKPGEAHSDRLLLLSRSIPAKVWVTDVRVEQGRFDVTGFTLEPDALNLWVGALSKHALMRGLKLSNISVENKSDVPTAAGGAAAPANGLGRVPMWSFNLVNLEPPAPAAATSAPAGGKS